MDGDRLNALIAPSPARYVPQMLVATALVAVLPPSAALALRLLGVITSPWLSMVVAVGLSLTASTVGNAYWRKRGDAGEILFSELLVWGWMRRRRQERQLANATRLLALASPTRATVPQGMTLERREQLLRQLAEALEGQDHYLNGHSRRVARHAAMIARGMGLPSGETARIRAAAAVHDVGKLLTPTGILNKPDRLSDAEFEAIKRHPVDGAEIVAALSDPELTRIVRHHHERLDGAGYPDGLTGEEIPLGARIIAVADTFDAITSVRPYRSAAPHQRAIDILREEAGAQLDPGAVRAFLDYYSGKRPMVAWTMITAIMRRIVAWLSGDPASAATIGAGKLVAATAATAVIGVSAAAPVAVVNAAQPTRVQAPSVAASVSRGGGFLHAHALVAAAESGPTVRATAVKPHLSPSTVRRQAPAPHAAVRPQPASSRRRRPPTSRSQAAGGAVGTPTSQGPPLVASAPSPPPPSAPPRGSDGGGNPSGAAGRHPGAAPQVGAPPAQAAATAAVLPAAATSATPASRAPTAGAAPGSSATAATGAGPQGGNSQGGNGQGGNGQGGNGQGGNGQGGNGQGGNSQGGNSQGANSQGDANPQASDGSSHGNGGNGSSKPGQAQGNGHD